MENTSQDSKLQEVETTLTLLKGKVSEVEGLVSQLKLVEQEAKSAVTQINTKKGSAEKKVEEIETKQRDIENISGSVQTLLTQIQTKTNDAEAIHTKLVQLRQKMEDGSSGIDATLKLVSDKKDSVTNNSETARKTLAEIVKLQESAKNLDKEIGEYKSQIDGYKKEIESMYSYINGAGLSHSFSERSHGLKKGVVFWAVSTFVSVVALVCILWWVFNHIDHSEMSEWVAVLYRITYSSPGIFLVWFCALQYSRERRLLESYAFKSATAKALENYTEVLERRFSEETYKNNILDFVLSSMKDIYSHPNNDVKDIEHEELEKNALAKIGASLKGFSEKVIEPISQIADKIKGLGVK